MTRSRDFGCHRPALRILSLMLMLVTLDSREIAAQQISCPTQSALSDSLRRRAIEYITSPDYADFRTEEGIGQIDTATVARVAMDSICSAVTNAINAVSITQRTTAFMVVQMGSYFAAAIPEGDVVDGVYILDATFRVLTVFVGT